MHTRRRQALAPALSELLSYPGEAFVKCAYLMILRRVADPSGLRHYLDELRAGTTRTIVVLRLAHSPEARLHGVYPIRYVVALAGALLLRLPLIRGLGPGPLPPEFDPVVYLQESPDVVMDGCSAYRHFLLQGSREGRSASFDASWYAEEYGDVIPADVSPREHYERYGRSQRRYPRFDAAWYLRENPEAAASGLSALEHYRTIGRTAGRAPAFSVRVDYPNWIRRFDAPRSRERARIGANAETLHERPVISVLMAIPGGEHPFLEGSLRSILAQGYPYRELCVALAGDAAASSRTLVERHLSAGTLVRVVVHPAKCNSAALKAHALALATGEWVAAIEPGDVLAEDALSCFAAEINRHPHARIIYADEDLISHADERQSPYFKCDWNPDLFLSHNLIGHAAAFRRELILAAGGFVPEAEDAADYDLALRCVELAGTRQIRHLPRVLYHGRISADQRQPDRSAKFLAPPGGIQALTTHLARRGVAAVAEATAHGYRVRYHLPEAAPLASLIIPTRNGLELLERCITSILSLTDYPLFEVLIVDNGSDDPATLSYLARITGDPRVRVIRDPRPFNYSALNNAAATLARGSLLALVNNDIEVITPGWLTEMVSHALRPEIGAVGAKLWYPNNTLQHGGVILGRGGAWHAHTGIALGDPGYMGRAAYVQSLSAVTGACLVVRKELYESLGGLNETDLTVAYNDVDFCLRALEAGYRNLWTPYAELYHHESASRGSDDTDEKSQRAQKELEYMVRRWGRAMWEDPAYSPNLSGEFDDFSFAWPPRVDPGQSS